MKRFNRISFILMIILLVSSTSAFALVEIIYDTGEGPLVYPNQVATTVTGKTNQSSFNNNHSIDINLNGETVKLDEAMIFYNGTSSSITFHNGTIDCQNKCAAFDLECAGLTINLYDIKIINGAAKDGAAIYVGDHSNLITNPKNDQTAIIKDCHASNCGGAIKMDAYSDGSKISNIVFNNCSADDDGGAILTNGKDNEINNCIFNSNHCEDAGGAIYVWDAATIDGCSFQKNNVPTASDNIIYGHDLFLKHYTTLRNCKFDHSRYPAYVLYSKSCLKEDTNNTFDYNFNTSTILSQGSIWVILSIVIAAFALCAVLILRKKSKGNTN